MRHQPDRPIGHRLGASGLRRQDGVETLEVALIGALIVVVLLIAVPLLYPGITQVFDDIADAMTNPEAQLD
jgi:Flp pilus assembly pilin Flp